MATNFKESTMKDIELSRRPRPSEWIDNLLEVSLFTIALWSLGLYW